MVTVNGHRWSHGLRLLLVYASQSCPLHGCIGPSVAIDQPRVSVQEVNPNFVVATLVGGLDAKDVTINIECTVHADVPLGFGTGHVEASAPSRTHTGFRYRVRLLAISFH